MSPLLTGQHDDVSCQRIFVRSIKRQVTLRAAPLLQSNDCASSAWSNLQQFLNYRNPSCNVEPRAILHRQLYSETYICPYRLSKTTKSVTATPEKDSYRQRVGTPGYCASACVEAGVNSNRLRSGHADALLTHYKKE